MHSRWTDTWRFSMTPILDNSVLFAWSVGSLYYRTVWEWGKEGEIIQFIALKGKVWTWSWKIEVGISLHFINFLCSGWCIYQLGFMKNAAELSHYLPSCRREQTRFPRESRKKNSPAKWEGCVCHSSVAEHAICMQKSFPFSLGHLCFRTSNRYTLHYRYLAIFLCRGKTTLG